MSPEPRDVDEEVEKVIDEAHTSVFKGLLASSRFRVAYLEQLLGPLESQPTTALAGIALGLLEEGARTHQRRLLGQSVIILRLVVERLEAADRLQRGEPNTN